MGMCGSSGRLVRIRGIRGAEADMFGGGGLVLAQHALGRAFHLVF